MNIVSTRPIGTLTSAAPRSAAVDSAKTDEPANQDSKPSALDSFSFGASKGASTANTVFGAWNGGVAGALTGGGLALGGSVVSVVADAVTGSGSIGWSTLLSTATTTGLWAAGGGLVGAVAGGVVLNKAGKFTGSIGADVARKLNLNENAGRAIGTMAPSLALGIAGASMLGWNSAAIVGGAAAIGGGLAYLKSQSC